MKAKMSGDKESIEDKLNIYKKILEKYTSLIKLEINEIQENDIKKYLNANEANLKSMNGEDCATGAYLLSQYALYIQKECNKEQSQMDWAYDTVLKIISPMLGQYSLYDREACRFAAINDNNAAKVAWAIYQAAKARVTQLSYISKNIENMATRLENLRRIKYEPNRTN